MSYIILLNMILLFITTGIILNKIKELESNIEQSKEDIKEIKNGSDTFFK